MRSARLGAQALSVALVIGLLGLLIWKVAHQTGSHNVAAEVRKGETPEAPDFTLPRLDGDGKLSLAAFAGKPRLVNFWASWCGPCRDEAPLLQNAARKYRGRLVVVGVDYQDFTGDARKFVHAFGLTYPIGRDGNGQLARALGRERCAGVVLHRPHGEGRRSRSRRRHEGRRSRRASGRRCNESSSPHSSLRSL